MPVTPLVHVGLTDDLARPVHDAYESARGRAQIEWDAEVERADGTRCTYWITVKNLTNASVSFDARYAALN